MNKLETAHSGTNVAHTPIHIPLHHRVEKWSIAKLVEQNKKVQMVNANKTVEKLEDRHNHIVNNKIKIE